MNNFQNLIDRKSSMSADILQAGLENKDKFKSSEYLHTYNYMAFNGREDTSIETDRLIEMTSRLRKNILNVIKKQEIKENSKIDILITQLNRNPKIKIKKSGDLKSKVQQLNRFIDLKYVNIGESVDSLALSQVIDSIFSDLEQIDVSKINIENSDILRNFAEKLKIELQKFKVSGKGNPIYEDIQSNLYRKTLSILAHLKTYKNKDNQDEKTTANLFNQILGSGSLNIISTSTGKNSKYAKDLNIAKVSLKHSATAAIAQKGGIKGEEGLALKFAELIPDYTVNTRTSKTSVSVKGNQRDTFNRQQKSDVQILIDIQDKNGKTSQKEVNFSVKNYRGGAGIEFHGGGQLSRFETRLRSHTNTTEFANILNSHNFMYSFINEMFLKSIGYSNLEFWSAFEKAFQQAAYVFIGNDVDIKKMLQLQSGIDFMVFSGTIVPVSEVLKNIQQNLNNVIVKPNSSVKHNFIQMKKDELAKIKDVPGYYDRNVIQIGRKASLEYRKNFTMDLKFSSNLVGDVINRYK